MIYVKKKKVLRIKYLKVKPAFARFSHVNLLGFYDNYCVNSSTIFSQSHLIKNN